MNQIKKKRRNGPQGHDMKRKLKLMKQILKKQEDAYWTPTIPIFKTMYVT
jgi:hypothetical protein